MTVLRVVPPGNRMPAHPWCEWRRYKVPISTCPMLDAAIWIHRKSGDARFVVTSDLGVYWSCPSLHPRHWGLSHEEEEVLVAKFVRKAVESNERKALEKSREGQRWEDSHPALWEYLSLDTHDDGSQRTTSMLCVFVEGGCVKVCLQDRDAGQSLWVSGASLVEALDSIEGRLANGDADWRQMRGPQAGKGNKRR